MATAIDSDADATINYVRGVDSGSLRSRTVTYNSIIGAWKLGDIINSTPQIQGSQALNSYATDYNDTSYAQFTSSNQYNSNNYVYVGANDGMLHASVSPRSSMTPTWERKSGPSSPKMFSPI